MASYRLAPESLKAWADFGYARPTPACMNTSVLGSVYICRNRRLLLTTAICWGLREGPRLHPGLMSRSRATQRLAGLPRVIAAVHIIPLDVTRHRSQHSWNARFSNQF